MTPADRRAPVQAERLGRDRCSAGTITWDEHLAAWVTYARRHGRDQSAERVAERGGFGLFELCVYLGRPPRTWEPA